MYTDQNYGADESGANAVKKTVYDHSLHRVQLDLYPGVQVEILQWALLSLKGEFHEEAADELAARDLVSYVDVLSRIEVVNELMDHLTVRLNESFERLIDHARNNDPRNIVARERLRQEEKIDALRKRFGWEENEQNADEA